MADAALPSRRGRGGHESVQDGLFRGLHGGREERGQGGVRETASRYEGDATMVVLEGATGREKETFPLPAPADDCFLFADLTGRGRREDLVVKDRYWNIWGVDHRGKVLWQWTGSPGHFPAVADVDDDGKDEVFVGFALIDDPVVA